MEQKTILLLNVRRVNDNKADNGADFLGVFYLAAVLEQNGYEPLVFHGWAHEVPEILAKEMEDRKVAAVGLACDFENQSVVEELSLYIKSKYPLPVIIGGPQAIAFGEEFFRKSCCDYVIRGEAEETLPRLLDYLIKGEGQRDAIQGITWLEDGVGLCNNEASEPIADLDTLPLPAYHCSLHRRKIYGSTVFTGRGCPFSCAFCFESTHKSKVRLRSLSKVMEEIEHNLKRAPELKYIIVADDTFTLNPQRVEGFCQGINQLRLQRDFVWYCESHISTLAKWPQMLDRMANAGLVRLQIGVESGCQKVLDLYGKRVALEQIQWVVSQAAAVGIPQIATNFIVGGPLESQEILQANMAFIESLLSKAPGVVDILTGFLRPYPGTAITENPSKYGLVIRQEDAPKSNGDYPTIMPEERTAEELINNRWLLNRHIAKVMNELLMEGAVPRNIIRSQYQNAVHYGITSLWYTDVFRKREALDQYFYLWVTGAARPLSEIPVSQIYQWRPQRTIPLKKMLDFTDGFPKLRNYVLSPLESELLLRCTGKLTWQDVLQELYQLFGKNFRDYLDFENTLQDIIRKFDKFYWVLFCKD